MVAHGQVARVAAAAGALLHREKRLVGVTGLYVLIAIVVS
jgi:hypothetical protein